MLTDVQVRAYIRENGLPELEWCDWEDLEALAPPSQHMDLRYGRGKVILRMLWIENENFYDEGPQP